MSRGFWSAIEAAVTLEPKCRKSDLAAASFCVSERAHLAVFRTETLLWVSNRCLNSVPARMRTNHRCFGNAGSIDAALQRTFGATRCLPELWTSTGVRAHRSRNGWACRFADLRLPDLQPLGYGSGGRTQSLITERQSDASKTSAKYFPMACARPRVI
jgi:hypothetical protein